MKTINELVALLSIKVAFGKSSLCEENFVKKNKELILEETLYDIYPEGFYLKTEKNSAVIGRYKFIRKSFMEIITKKNHWENRIQIKNNLLM